MQLAKPCLWNVAQPTERRDLLFFDAWVKQRLSRKQPVLRARKKRQRKLPALSRMLTSV